MDQQNSESLRLWLAERRGRQVALAAHVGVRPTVVSAWISGRRPVPVEHAADIEVFSGGAVSRKALFPGDWQRIWPELAGSEPNQPPAPAHQARVAINSEAKEAAHV